MLGRILFIFYRKPQVSLWQWSIVLLLGCCFKMTAQQSSNVQFSVVLTDIQSITLNQNQSNVSISLNNVSEYSNGKTSAQTDHLEITSSSEYEIKVSASSQLQGNSATIPINTVGISASLGSVGGIPATPIVFSDIMLSANSQTLVQADQGDTGRSFNVEYAVSGGTDYLNKPTGVYSTTITYSILPK